MNDKQHPCATPFAEINTLDHSYGLPKPGEYNHEGLPFSFIAECAKCGEKRFSKVVMYHSITLSEFKE